MTAHGVGPSTRPTENWQHHFSYWTSTGTEARLTQSAYRNTVENNKDAHVDPDAGSGWTIGDGTGGSNSGLFLVRER